MFIQGAINEKFLSELHWAENNTTGAIASFTGIVRGDKVDGKKVVSIEFTAQTTITNKVIGKITEEAKTRFGIKQVEVLHSLGEVKVGEICFLVVVKAGHRRECFSALPYIVDAIKDRCPIFGKEILCGGEYRWKKNK